MTALTAKVADHHGVPTLFVNGQPHSGCMFWHSRVPEAAPDLRLFHDAGIDLFTCGLDASYGADGGWDFTRFDATMDAVLAANPKALVLPRIWLEPPKWWLERYPDEVQVHYDAVNGDEIRRYISFGSRRWREDTGRLLPELIRHGEERWGEHLFGYHLCAGACGEWSYSWDPVVSGYSVAQQAAFRDWLRQRYAGDQDALRQAWADAAVTFDAATVPPPAQRVRNRHAWPRTWSCFRPDTERRAIDYLLFHSEAVATAINHFARLTKTTLRELGREKLCGVFYAYHVCNLDTPYVAHNAGHHAAALVLASPDIDFISAPLNYDERHAGGGYHSQLLPHSVRLHGKLYYDEDDTFTHLAKETPWRPKCRDAAETVNILWRNFAATVREGGAYWWMDHDGQGWYRDAKVMAAVAGMRRFAERQLADPRRRAVAQVAVVYSPRSHAFLRYDPALVDALGPKQLSEILALGAPCDFYETGDLDLLLHQDWARHYRLIIFCDALYLSDDERRTIRLRLAGAKRTLLWCYAAGLLTETDVSPEAMTALTGIRVRLNDRVGPLRAETFLTGTRLTYGTCAEVGPELVGDDPEAEPLAWSLYRGQPLLMRRPFSAGWTSIWSGAPVLPAAVLRQVARDAGVHVYADSGDWLTAAADFLCLHAAFAGERTLTLAAPADVLDVRTGKPLAHGAENFTVFLERGQTGVWTLCPPG